MSLIRAQRLASLVRPVKNGFAYGVGNIFGATTNPRLLRFPNCLIDPVIDINPHKVKLIASLDIKPKSGCAYFLKKDWDKTVESIEERFERDAKYRTAREILVQKIPIEQTSEMQSVERRIKKSGNYRGYESASQFMQSVADLYNSLEKEGYQRSLIDRIYPWLGGVEAVIGADLELIKINGGNHRFAASYVLGIGTIPLQICALDECYFNSAHPIKTIRQVLNRIQDKYA